MFIALIISDTIVHSSKPPSFKKPNAKPVVSPPNKPSKAPNCKKPVIKKCRKHTQAPTGLTNIVKSKPTNLTLLHVNDHHSHLASTTFSLLDIPPGLSIQTTDIKVEYGGYPMMTTMFDRLTKDSKADDVLKIHAGDAITGTNFYTIFKGAAGV